MKVLFSSKSVDVCTSRLVHHFFRVLKVFTINIRWWLKHSKTYIWRSTGLLGWRRIKWHRALSLWWWMLRHMVLYPQRQHQNRLLGGPFWCRVMFLGSVIFWLLSSACVSQCPVLYYTARLHGSCAPPPERAFYYWCLRLAFINRNVTQQDFKSFSDTDVIKTDRYFSLSPNYHIALITFTARIYVLLQVALLITRYILTILILLAAYVFYKIQFLLLSKKGQVVYDYDPALGYLPRYTQW